MVSHRSRLRAALSLAALAALALAAANAVSAPAKSPFPLTLHAANGAVTIPSRPTRIVSLSPAATEDLFSVGAGPQVVAVDSYSTYPPQAPHTSLSGGTPNVEAIAKYHPDLVVVYIDDDNIVGHLEELHIPVLLEPAAPTLAGAYAQVEQLGEATGHAAAADQVVAGLERRVSALVHSVPRPKKPLSVYVEVGTNPYFAATSKSFVGQIPALFGLRNIADSSGSNPYPSLSSEYIVASDPGVIILADTVCCGQSAATVAARPGWSTTAAVRDGAVLPVNDSIATEWGTRIIQFVQIVADEVRKLETAR
jgi:iron complex transport system substrate-binding protein